MFDEKEVIKRILDGDRNAYSVLVDRYGGPVYAYCYDRTGNRADAEDMAQEAFLIAFRKLGALKRRGSFLQWIFGISANLAKTLRSNLEKVDTVFGVIF